jgi:hypothetical protein
VPTKDPEKLRAQRKRADAKRSPQRRGPHGWETEAREPYYVQTGRMWDNPFGVSQDEVADYILSNPPEIVAQVVFGRYVESSGLVFGGDLIQQMIDRTIPVVKTGQWVDLEMMQQCKMLMDRDDGWAHGFYTGVDLARVTDYTVIFTLDCRWIPDRPARVVYYKRLNKVNWEHIYAEIGRARHLFGPQVLLDSTGMGGDIVLDALWSRLYCPVHHRTMLLENPGCRDAGGNVRLDCDERVYEALSGVDGYAFTGTTKRELVQHLRSCLSVGYNPSDPYTEFGWIRTPPIPQLEEELAFYAWEDKRLQTDALFALALAAWAGLEEPVGSPLYGSVYGD